MLLDQRIWPLAVWRERYLDHRLVSRLARRLIWQVDGGKSFLPVGDGFVDENGKPVEIPSTATVRLWHPIDSTADGVMRWRQMLAAREVTQPFKQAHREVYLLTDAERRTATYSNRFAAHILRQHQFQALCDARGWTYRLMGNFDSHNIPTRVLPRHGMAVEFWVEAAPPETTAAGIFTHLSTDQVRFNRWRQPTGRGMAQREGVGDLPMPLEEVPPIVFSELMRDVDLFVGVASVGNDPAWQDGGTEGRYRAYWANYSFGELSETAKTRREVLAGLLPRLTKLAGKWTLEDRFLKIEGSLRTYKIHLGSGNILMEPNDQYLCIVPDRSTKEAGTTGVFLPFEGDGTLSVILSKALLLVDDKKIKDPTITRQLMR